MSTTTFSDLNDTGLPPRIQRIINDNIVELQRAGLPIPKPYGDDPAEHGRNVARDVFADWV